MLLPPARRARSYVPFSRNNPHKILKICKFFLDIFVFIWSSQKIVVPLSRICAGREVSLCNRVDLDILNSVYWRFAFCGSKLRNFLIPNKNQSNSRCLWVWPCIRAALYLGSGVLSYQRRFPVVYFIRWAMRRPRTANKQLEVCAFFVCLCVCYLIDC